MYAIWKFQNALTKERLSVLLIGKKAQVMSRVNALATILHLNPDYNPIKLARVGFYTRKADMPAEQHAAVDASTSDIIISDKFNERGHYIWPEKYQRTDMAPYYEYVDGVWKRTDYHENS